jgi:hypothetical protein
MPTGNTPRVQRLVRAYGLVFSEERAPLFAPRVSTVRIDALRNRIAALLPKLTHEESDAYYAQVKRLREIEHEDGQGVGAQKRQTRTMWPSR